MARRIDFAEAMIAQDLDDTAPLCLTSGAGADHALQLSLQSAQLLEPSLDRPKVCRGNGIRLPARASRVFRQLEEVADLGQFEPQLTGMANERQPPHVTITIKAPTAPAARRGWQQTLSFVEPDGRDLQACLSGNGTNRQHGA